VWNIVEEPWLLLFVALVTLGVVVFVQTNPAGPRRRWPWLIPAALAVLAFAVDAVIDTDRERLDATLHRAFQFARTRDFTLFDDIFAPDYADDFHPSRRALRRRCETSMAIADIERIRIRRLTWQIEPGLARCDLSVLVRLQGRRGTYAGSQGIYFVEIEMLLSKQPDKRWLIQTIDLKSLNHQRFDWGGVP